MNTAQHYKFPQIAHLPWSGGVVPRTDGVWSDEQVCAAFEGREVVVTEKMDGENTSMYIDHIHARSRDSRNHPSRNWVKRLHARIAHRIQDGWRICGENLYARHSIGYSGLPSYFLVFAVYDPDNVCLAWDETIEWAHRLDLTCVPVLYRGIYKESKVKTCFTGRSVFSDASQEGYVVRRACAFAWSEHASSMAKFVRKGHVQTDCHWMTNKIIKNHLQQHR